MYNTIDDFVMTNLKTYAGRPIKTAEAEDIDLGEDAAKDGEESAPAPAGLSTEDAEDLCSWLKESALTDKVRVVIRLSACWYLLVAHASKFALDSRVLIGPTAKEMSSQSESENARPIKMADCVFHVGANCTMLRMP